MLGGQPQLSLGSIDRGHAVAQRRARREIERQRNHRELSLVIDGERNLDRLQLGKRAQRHLRRLSIECTYMSGQVPGVLLKLRLHFQNHVILVQLRENGRDLALAERVVQSIVDHLRRDAEPRRCVAINHQTNLQPAVLLVAGDVAQFRRGLQLFDKAWRPETQFRGVRIFEAVLKLGAAHADLPR